MIKDPDGHDVEIMEYFQTAGPGRTPDAHVPASRISEHAMHVGILVGDLEASMKFYNGVLGFLEFWRGSAANSKTLSWVNMRVPDGTDYFELMFHDQIPAPDHRGSAHHLCLVVPDADQALAALNARPSRAAYLRPMEIRTGINRKRQVNLFDPDGTRVELIERARSTEIPRRRRRCRRRGSPVVRRSWRHVQAGASRRPRSWRRRRGDSSWRRRTPGSRRARES